MSLIFPPTISAIVGAAPAPRGPRHFRHYRHFGHFRSASAAGLPLSPAPEDAGGESFVRGGRRYYWFLRGGRRVYSTHPPAGYQPVSGPTPGGAAAATVPGGVADLDEPLSPSEQAAQAARARQAQARLASLEHRIGRLRHLERLRAHPVRPLKKRR